MDEKMACLASLEGETTIEVGETRAAPSPSFAPRMTLRGLERLPLVLGS